MHLAVSQLAVTLYLLFCFVLGTEAGTNIALGKHTIESSTAYGGLSKFAVDGNPDTVSHSGAYGGRSEYIIIDLGKVHHIFRVIVEERDYNGNGYGGFYEILVGNAYSVDAAKDKGNYLPCGEVIIKPKRFERVECHRTGRYVMLHKTKNSLFLILRELKVYGVPIDGGDYNPWLWTDKMSHINGKIALGLTGTGHTYRFDRITTGSRNWCDWVNRKYKYLLFDIGHTVKNPVIKLYGRAPERIMNFDVSIGRFWLPCKPEMVKDFAQCARVNNKTLNSPCTGIGRYIAIHLKVFETSSIGGLTICHGELFSKDLVNDTAPLKSYEQTCNSIPNLASRKPVYMSQNIAHQPERLVDGDIRGVWADATCMSMKPTKDNWIVIDLQAIYQIEHVRVWSRGEWWRTDYISQSNRNISISLSMNYRPCQSKVLDTFTQCYKQTKAQVLRPLDARCMGSARFIAIRQNLNDRWFSLCEVEVFGKKERDVSTEVTWRDACTVLKDKSVAYKKPAYVKGGRFTQRPNFVDGNLNTKDHVPVREWPWIVVDLQATAEVELVRLFRLSGSSAITGVVISVGGEWLPCSARLANSFVKCSTVAKTGEVNEIRCPSQSGRFVALQAIGNGTLEIADIEVFSSKPVTPISITSEPKWKETCNVINEANLNAALNKPVFINPPAQDANRLTDGKVGTCKWSSKVGGWMVVDLQKIYVINAVRFWGIDQWWREPITNIEIRVLQKLDPCRPKILTEGIPCQPVLNGKDYRPYSVDCAARGQYVAVAKKKDDNNPIILCEIEVFGTLDKSAVPVTPFPLPSVEGPAPTNYLDARTEILNGITTASIGRYCTNVIPGPNTSQPILVKPNAPNQCCMAVAEYGQGRIAVFGQANMPVDYAKDGGALGQNLRNWLTRGKTPHRIYNAYSVKESDFQTPGGIIVWSGLHGNQNKNAPVALITRLVKTGKASIMIGEFGWSMTSVERPAYHQIIDEAGIQLTGFWMLGGATTWTVAGVPKFDQMSLQSKLDYIAASPSMYLKKGIEVLRDLGKLKGQVLDMMHTSEKLTALADQYEPHMKSIEPCARRPIHDAKQKQLIDVFSRILTSQGLANSKRIALTADMFPGTIPRSTPRETVTIRIKADTGHEHHPTGLYLPPGETATFTVTEGKPEFWSAVVGCTTDDVGKKDITRDNIVSASMPLISGRMYNAYGGTIWITNKHGNSNITLRISNVIRAPFFNLRDPANMARWDATSRNYPGLWAEVAGDAFIFCVRSQEVRKLSRNYLYDLTKNIWDAVVKGDNWLKGEDWKVKRRERMSLDIISGAGAGHSGYPTVGTFSWITGLANSTNIRKGAGWGVYHEIGHNLQLKEWTFHGTHEVTNNLFALFDKYLLKVDYLDGYPVPNAKKYLQNCCNFGTWTSDPFVALHIYGQIAKHFGFMIYRKAFVKYKTDKLRPTVDLDKRMTWIEVLSNVSNHNLVPLFEFWGFEVTPTTKAKLAGLPAFLPDDKMTQVNTQRANTIAGRYPGIKRSVAQLPGSDQIRATVAAMTNEILNNDVEYL